MAAPGGKSDDKPQMSQRPARRVKRTLRQVKSRDPQGIKDAVAEAKKTEKEGSEPKRPQSKLIPRRKPSMTMEESSVHQKNTARKDADLVVDAAITDFVDNHIQTLEPLRADYRKIGEIIPEEGEHLRCCQMKERNRYEAIPCLDATRIVLKSDTGECDFIHANRCQFEKADRDYILAQAPMKHTVEDFWRMIFQETSPLVVVLCSFYEQGRESSDAFWPMSTGQYEYYGKMFINNKKAWCGEICSVYTIEILPDGCSNSHVTTLFHCTLWEASSLPTKARTLQRLRSQLKDEKGPMTVVSSEGIGRAAVFTIVDVLIGHLLKGNKTCLYEVACRLRKQRALSVTTELQYVFCVQTVLDYIRAKHKKHANAVIRFNKLIAEV